MRIPILAALLAAACSACVTPSGPAAGSEGAKVLARVDGEPVAMDGYRSWLADVHGHETREEYLGCWLLEREARRLDIAVTDEEIDAAREKLYATWIRDMLQGDASALDGYLARQGHDRESYRRWFARQKRRELLATRVILRSRELDDVALVRRFEQVYGPNGVRTQVRLLVLTRARLSQELARRSDSRTLTAAELDQRLLQQAEALRARALAGESFEALVRSESADLAVRKSGGLCGDDQWRLRGAAFVAAVKDAPLRIVQPPVPNSSGIDLFEVVSREITRFEDVRADLADRMKREPPSLDEVTALDQRLRSAARIEPP